MQTNGQFLVILIILLVVITFSGGIRQVLSASMSLHTP